MGLYDDLQILCNVVCIEDFFFGSFNARHSFVDEAYCAMSINI
jgi:hypothetical protein